MAKYNQSIYQPNKGGKVGGSVFAKGRYGPYERIKTNPVQPRTPYQMDVRTKQKSVSMLWKSLTSDQKTVWDNVPVVFGLKTKGNRGFMTGYQLFMQINRNLLDIGEAMLEDCPQQLISPEIITSFSVSIDLTPGSETITADFAPAITAGNKLVISATPFLNSQSQKGNKFLRVITVKDHTFISGGSIKSEYLARFKAMPLNGSAVLSSAKCIDTATGQTGPVWQYMAVGAI
jgi:hypothetical protein